MNLVSVTNKGQIIIPALIRRKYHLEKGSKMKIEEIEDGILILKPIPDYSDPIERTRGILKGKNSLLESLLIDRRGEASR